MAKPIRVFFSSLTERFYATHHWAEREGFIEITGKKYDVTQDIAAAVVNYDVVFSPVNDAGKEAGDGEG